MNTDTDTPDKNEGQEVLPCPFCGSKNLSFYIGVIRCVTCLADGPPADSEDDASILSAWNTRKALSNSEGT